MKWYPRDRVADVLHRWCDEWRITRPAQGGEYGVANPNTQMGALEWLVENSGVPHRSIYRIMHGPSEYERARDRSKSNTNRTKKESTYGTNVSHASVDKLFCAMGMLHLYHLPPEEGGFADLYDPYYGLPLWWRAILEELEEHDDDADDLYEPPLEMAA